MTERLLIWGALFVVGLLAGMGVHKVFADRKFAILEAKHSAQLAEWNSKVAEAQSKARAREGELQQAIDMINKAERPVLIAGHGTFVRKACDALMLAVEKHEMADVGSGPVHDHLRLLTGLSAV